MRCLEESVSTLNSSELLAQNFPSKLSARTLLRKVEVRSSDSESARVIETSNFHRLEGSKNSKDCLDLRRPEEYLKI